MFDMTPDPFDGTITLTGSQKDRMEAVAAQLNQLNAAIREAVDEGLSVELHRSERHHCGQGCWGDMMRPVIVKCK